MVQCVSVSSNYVFHQQGTLAEKTTEYRINQSAKRKIASPPPPRHKSFKKKKKCLFNAFPALNVKTLMCKKKPLPVVKGLITLINDLISRVTGIITLLIGVFVHPIYNDRFGARLVGCYLQSLSSGPVPRPRLEPHLGDQFGGFCKA